jgi:hypothetical protein
MLQVCALAHLALALAQSGVAVPQPETDLWPGAEACGPGPLAPSVTREPLTPEQWLVVPAESPATDAELFARHLLQPDSRPPRAGAEDGIWEERSAPDLAGVRWAYTRVESDADVVLMARLSGAGLLYVDGEPFVGDRERRGFQGVPVALAAGANDVFVTDVDGSFELVLWKPPTRLVLGTWDAEFPPAYVSELVTFPVFNASTAPASCLHVHYGHAAWAQGPRRPMITDWSDGAWIPPLGLVQAGTFFLDGFGPGSEGVVAGVEALVPIVVYSNGDQVCDRRLLRQRVPEVGDPPRFPGRDRSAVREGLFARVTLGLEEPTEVLLVYGTHGTPAEVEALLARMRFDQQWLWYHTRIPPRAMSDETALAAIERERARQPNEISWPQRYGVILYGNEDMNSAWRFFIPEECPVHARRGSIEGPGIALQGDGVTGWFLCGRDDLHDGRLVTVICDTGARASRLGTYMQPLAHALVGEELAFYDGEGVEHGEPRLLAKGFFDGLGGIVR